MQLNFTMDAKKPPLILILTRSGLIPRRLNCSADFCGAHDARLPESSKYDPSHQLGTMATRTSAISVGLRTELTANPAAPSGMLSAVWQVLL